MGLERHTFIKKKKCKRVPEFVIATIATDRFTLIEYNVAMPRKDIKANVCLAPQHSTNKDNAKIVNFEALFLI